MATADQITEVRNNTNTTTSQYSDVVVGNLIDDTSVNCASATIWKWQLATLSSQASSIKRSSAGIESHEYQSIKDQVDYNLKMYNMYNQLCKEDNNEGNVRMIKVEQPRVGGVITEDEINELLS